MSRKNTIPPELAQRIRASGATITQKRRIDHATQYRLSAGAETATLNVYDTGRVLEGGKESSLKRLLREYRLSSPSKGSRTGSESGRAAGGSPEVPGTVVNPTPRVGTDEAGKGDYFGPLVVAGVRVKGRKDDEALRKLGVRDSKTLGAAGVERLARGIEELAGPENLRVICLPPRQYARRWEAAGRNVNWLLGELNVEVIRELESEVEVAVVDAFGVRAGEYVEEGGFTGLKVEARPRAEDDAAVAAASILARSRYLEEMEVLSSRVGFGLPRGSTHVLRAARRVFEERGEEGLRDVAKFHFALTDRVVSGTRRVGKDKE